MNDYPDAGASEQRNPESNCVCGHPKHPQFPKGSCFCGCTIFEEDARRPDRTRRRSPLSEQLVSNYEWLLSVGETLP